MGRRQPRQSSPHVARPLRVLVVPGQHCTFCFICSCPNSHFIAGGAESLVPTAFTAHHRVGGAAQVALAGWQNCRAVHPGCPVPPPPRSPPPPGAVAKLWDIVFDTVTGHLQQP